MPGRNIRTNALFFIDKEEIPADRWKYMTYGEIVCNARPRKEETNHTRLTFGGNNTKTTIDCGTPTANLLTVKRLINGIVLAPGAKFLELDLKYFYLNTRMEWPEFLRMKFDNFHERVIEQYKLKDKSASMEFVIQWVDIGMNRVPYAGIVAQKLLK